MNRWLQRTGGVVGLILAAWLVSTVAPASVQPDDAVVDVRPEPGRFLFWTPAEQKFGYRNMERIFPTRVVSRGSAAIAELPRAKGELPLNFVHNGQPVDTDAFMRDTNVEGLLVMVRGRVVLERYGADLTANERWTSWSVAKSITSTLVGAAIQDGFIHSIEDPVTRYLPELSGSAYDAVTLRQLLTMTSGVRWSEDYRDPHSDVNQFAHLSEHSGHSVLDYMAGLKRETQPGTRFVYKTGETDLIGLLVSRATHKGLADYLSEKIWSHAGMARDAVWALDASGSELSGCCLSMTLEDYARFGLFFMDGGHAGGRQVLPANWVSEATHWAVRGDTANLGYGFQWWVGEDKTYQALGIFGQAMYFDPRHELLVVVLGSWPSASDKGRFAERQAFFEALSKAVSSAPPG
ncbi:serine hydrolase [Pseudomonas batumici]|uniref:serine hydrolase domain-containing protein n=1 Tax=Pseudomonas batumici TaxID=226910 RepID=UPI0030D49840